MRKALVISVIALAGFLPGAYAHADTIFYDSPYGTATTSFETPYFAIATTTTSFSVAYLSSIVLHGVNAKNHDLNMVAASGVMEIGTASSTDCSTGAHLYAVEQTTVTGDGNEHDATMTPESPVSLIGVKCVYFSLGDTTYTTGSGQYYRSDSGRVAQADFYGNDTDTYTCTGSDSTRVVSLSPPDGANETSPVTLAMHACIKQSDLDSFGSVDVGFNLIDQNNLDAGGVTQTLFAGYASNAGDFYYATTTSLPNGNYAVKAVLFSRYLNIITGSEYEAPSIHQFVVGTSTYLGGFAQSLVSDEAGYFAGLSATSSNVIAAQCNPLSFDVRGCLTYMLLGSPQAWEDFGSRIYQTVLVKFPWGYATRAFTIVSSTASSSLPSLVLSGPSDMVAISGLSIDLTPWNDIATTSSYTAFGDHKTLREILEPGWDLLVYFSLAFGIMRKVLSMHHKQGHIA